METALDKWRQANGCSLIHDDERLSQDVTFYRWNDCEGSAEIHFYQIARGGHTWPGGPVGSESSQAGITNQDIGASELIWAFFSRHRLP